MPPADGDSMPLDGEAAIRAIVGASEDVEPDDEAEIARLAKLPLVQYGRERIPAAKRLGFLVSILDRAVAAERGNGAAPGQGRPLDLAEPEPWPEPVNGAQLLDDQTTAIRQYVVLGDAEADAVALWALAVHPFDAWRVFPRLLIMAPEKGCGKTTLLDVLFPLVPRPLAASNIKAAALFRRWRGDQADALHRGAGAVAEVELDANPPPRARRPADRAGTPEAFQMMKTQPDSRCLWCGRTFALRATGGSRKPSAGRLAAAPSMLRGGHGCARRSPPGG
jgi:hypothetical protein